MSRTTRISVPVRPAHELLLGSDLLDDVGREIAAVVRGRRAVLVTDEGLAGTPHPERVARSVAAAGLHVVEHVLPSGEAAKDVAPVTALWDALAAAEITREDVVIAVGGGSVGDAAGFAAATWMRGVAVVQVPTTVLAMADSSLGGKTAIDRPQGKNLVGAFHQPQLVWIDAAVLDTLPPRQVAAGLAEVVKHAAIWDGALFERLETDLERLVALEPEVLVPILARNCEIKAEVVSRDERESGLRMLLNFGHTLGHAIETLTRYRRHLHGEAVAMGMVFAAHRSEQLGLAPEGTAARITALLARAALPTQLPDFPRRAYLGAIRVDKKKRDSRIRFVASRGIGRAETVPLTPEEILPARGAGRGRARP